MNLKKLWRDNKAVLILIFSLAWPAMLEQAFQTVVQYADSAMVGRLGAQASAAVGLTTPVCWLVNSPMFALGIGFLSCIARAIGAKDEQRARIAAMQSIFAVIVVGISFGIITVSLSPVLPVWLKGSEEIQHDAGAYFAIICVPMLFRASTVIFGSTLRASGDTRTPMMVSTMMNIINVVLNYFLIFKTHTVRLFGWSLLMPGAGLGVIGAAIATAIAYAVSGTFMFAAFMRNKTISPRGLRLRLDKPVMKQCIRVGIPVACSRIGVCLGQVVFLSQVSTLGTIPLAAHSLALTAETAIYLPASGMQVAASTLAGNAVGERNEHKLMRVSGMITLISALMMTLTGAFMFCFPRFLMSIFTADEQVILQGIGVMRIIAVTEPIYAVAIIMEGIFNGVGDTRAPFIISVGTMWGVRILFTFLCVQVFHLGLNAVWCCMAGDNIARALLLTIRFFGQSWKKPLNLFPNGE